jgi:hypothetical protein
MGWFSKPKEGDIYWTKLPEEGKKLAGDKPHPVIINSNNEDDTSNVIGCSSKKQKGLEIEDVPVKSSPGMRLPSYARVNDGERLVDNYKLRKDDKDNACENLEEIRGRLKR